MDRARSPTPGEREIGGGEKEIGARVSPEMMH